MNTTSASLWRSMRNLLKGIAYGIGVILVIQGLAFWIDLAADVTGAYLLGPFDLLVVAVALTVALYVMGREQASQP